MAPEEDRRIRMTKQMLRNSLIELLKEKPLHSISIKEICVLADLNRSTFYRHYATTYELYEDILAVASEDVAKIIERHKQGREELQTLMVEILEHAEANRELFLVLLNENGNLNVGELFSDNVKKVIKKVRPQQNVTPELELYIIQFFAAGVANFLWTWLNDDRRHSPKMVATFISTLAQNGLRPRDDN